MYGSIRLALLPLVIALVVAQAPGHAQSPAALLQSANAMGGPTALRALKTQVIESAGKQFDSSSTPQPLGPTRQITTFRYTLTRDFTQPRLRLQWEGQSLGSNQAVRFVETIDGSIGMLQEGGDGGKQVRLHPGRFATRLREERRNPARLILAALNQKSLRHAATPSSTASATRCCHLLKAAMSFASISTRRCGYRRKSKFSKTILSKATAAIRCAAATGAKSTALCCRLACATN